MAAAANTVSAPAELYCFWVNVHEDQQVEKSGLENRAVEPVAAQPAAMEVAAETAVMNKDADSAVTESDIAEQAKWPLNGTDAWSAAPYHDSGVLVVREYKIDAAQSS